VAAKGTLHKKTVARKKSRLARRLNQARAAKPA
jgi:ribosomal protein S20